MANTRHKDTVFINATGAITVDAVVPILYGALVTPSAANSLFELKETNASGVTKLEIRIEAAESRFIDFSGFPGGGVSLTPTIYVNQLTNITSIQLYGNWVLSAGKAQ